MVLGAAFDIIAPGTDIGERELTRDLQHYFSLLNGVHGRARWKVNGRSLLRENAAYQSPTETNSFSQDIPKILDLLDGTSSPRKIEHLHLGRLHHRSHIHF